MSKDLSKPTPMTRVVVAASTGTVFEYYDFFLYGSLVTFFGALFFPPGNETAALLASLAAFGAGFAVRPIGALVFGRLGDRVGRKQTFLITIVLMGLATALVGLIPTFEVIGWWAPALLVTLLKPVGALAPDDMLWTFMGTSVPYQMFTGWAEVIAGLLLLVPRTALVGGLLALADMVQVFMLNMSYDVSLKQTSSHLVFISLFLLAPDARRLVTSLVFERLKTERRALDRKSTRLNSSHRT